MFVYNVKVNGSKIFKIFFTAVVALVTCILCFVVFRIFSGADSNNSNLSGCVKQNGIYQISPSNYTNVLKAVHDDIDSYVGTKICFTGYVYRLFDFSNTQFVLARDMVISSDFQTVVVGFLCEAKNASSFSDNTWIELTGKITKGNYHGDMPIIEVTDIKNCDKPNEELVYPPDETYIPVDGAV